MIILFTFLLGLFGKNLRYTKNEASIKLWNLGMKTCYGVMFDGGSSGTRVYVYSWDCRESQTMPMITLTEQSIEKKVKPGISTFAGHIDQVEKYLQPLIDFASSNVPKNMRQYTPIMFGATAGMRLLPESQSLEIINEVRRLLIKSGFLFINNQWARIITGQEEGAYMWLSLNYLLGRMQSNEQVLTIDLGGASTQLSFSPKVKIEENDMDIIIPNINEYEIYSFSHLLYGMDQALIQTHKSLQNNETMNITSPCFFEGYYGNYTYDSKYKVIGTGNYKECQEIIYQYLNNDPLNCNHSNCGINGVYQPIIDSNVIYGLSGIQSMVELFGYENFTLTQYEKKVISFTNLVWEDIKQIPEYINNPYIMTDYFSSIYVNELLQTGYGIPKDQMICSPDLIDGITPTWTVAAMFYQLAQIQCQYDSPILTTACYQIDRHYQPFNWFDFGDTACYGIMFDAGSSGTRVFVYSWSCRENKTMAYINITEKTLEYKVQPGIDYFGKDLEGLKTYMNELIQFAYENVPYTMYKYTPIMLAATAGMRMIPSFYQVQIIQTIRDIFRSSKFLFHRDEWCRIISGQEEGAFMWLSINYAIGKLGITDNEHAVTIDLGGGSTQLAFKPESKIDINEINLRIPNHNQYKIYSISYLFYGIDQAIKTIFEREIQKLESNNLVYNSPCFHNGYRNQYRYNNSYIVIGSGDINQCREIIQKYLNNDKSKCIYENCGINGLYQPEIDSDQIYVIGGVQFMAEFLNLTEFTLEEYFIRTVKFCSLSYQEIQSIPHYSNNKYVNSNYFTTLYVYELLKHGYGIKENILIKSPAKIGNITPSWTLAAMFYQIAQIDCEKDSPLCSTIMNK